jgi:hypothetical protein
MYNAMFKYVRVLTLKYCLLYVTRTAIYHPPLTTAFFTLKRRVFQTFTTRTSAPLSKSGCQLNRLSQLDLFIYLFTDLWFVVHRVCALVIPGIWEAQIC